MSSNDFYVAVANQTNNSVNSPIVQGQNTCSDCTITPSFSNLSCQVCEYNYCYQSAIDYSGSGLIGSIETSNICGYTNPTACSLGVSENTCRYNGNMLDWEYDSVLCVAGIGGIMPLCATVDPSLCILYDINSPNDISSSYTGYIYNTLTTPCVEVPPYNGTNSICNSSVPTSYNGFVSWNNNNDQTNSPEDGRYINCNFNKNLFTDNLGPIQSYYNNYISPNSKIVIADTVGKANTSNLSNYNTIMQDFSEGISTDVDATCPLYTIYPYNSQQPATCSRFVATGDQGDWVRSWVSGTQVSGTIPSVSSYTDNAKNKYCSDPANFNSPECQCINRTTVDPNYIKTQQLLDAPPACWYIPCQDSTKYLITSDISNVVCDSNVCQNISISIAQSGGQINSQEMQTISCTVNNNDSTNDNTDDNTNNNTSNNFSIPTWLWIVLGIVIVIGIIIILVLIFRKNK